MYSYSELASKTEAKAERIAIKWLAILEPTVFSPPTYTDRARAMFVQRPTVLPSYRTSHVRRVPSSCPLCHACCYPSQGQHNVGGESVCVLPAGGDDQLPGSALLRDTAPQAKDKGNLSTLPWGTFPPQPPRIFFWVIRQGKYSLQGRRPSSSTFMFCPGSNDTVMISPLFDMGP